MNKSINFRKDNRTDKQFAKDIKHRTAKEKYLVELFKKECEDVHVSCIVENNGIDNTGKVVKKSNCDADYKITIAGKSELYEIKCSPVNSKWTFKVYQLQQYVKQSANILIFYGTGYIDKDPSKIDRKNTRYGIISPKCIKTMLEKYKHYNEYMFGGKLCIQIPHGDFDCFIKPAKLEHLLK